MDRVRAASGRQKPTAPTTRLMRAYCSSLLSTLLSSARAPRGRASRCSRSLHLDARPEGGARVELSVSSTFAFGSALNTDYVRDFRHTELRRPITTGSPGTRLHSCRRRDKRRCDVFRSNRPFPVNHKEETYVEKT